MEHIIKKHDTVGYNPPVRIYVNKIENRTTFKTGKRYYLQLLTPERMKLIGSTKSKIPENENDEISEN